MAKYVFTDSPCSRIMGPGCSRTRCTVAEYRYGSSGVQRCGVGIFSRAGLPVATVAPATPGCQTGPPPTTTSADTLGDGALISTRTSTSPLSTSGEKRTFFTYSVPGPGFGTGSIQTVCQMPVTGVYQMPPGRLTCLPRG